MCKTLYLWGSNFHSSFTPLLQDLVGDKWGRSHCVMFISSVHWGLDSLSTFQCIDCKLAIVCYLAFESVDKISQISVGKNLFCIMSKFPVLKLAGKYFGRTVTYNDVNCVESRVNSLDTRVRFISGCDILCLLMREREKKKAFFRWLLTYADNVFTHTHTFQNNK